MLVLGAIFALGLGGALERRAVKAPSAVPAEGAVPSLEKNHWMF